MRPTTVIIEYIGSMSFWSTNNIDRIAHMVINSLHGGSTHLHGYVDQALQLTAIKHGSCNVGT